MVRLHKNADRANIFEINADTLSQEKTPNLAQEAACGGSLEQSSRLDAYLRAWTLTKEYAVDFIKAYQKLRLYLSAFLNSQATNDRQTERGGDIIQATIKAFGENNTNGGQRAYETFLDEAKNQAWNTIISSMGLDKYMTSSMEETMRRFRKAQGNFELTKENIMALFQLLMSNLGNIMKNNIVSVYDTFTRYYDGNTACEEGWKTNKRFRANKKIILPYAADAGYMPEKYGYHKNFSVSYHSLQTIRDIDKAMCWLSGRNFESLDGKNPDSTTIYDVICSYAVGDTAWIPSAFFLVKCFKKGTVHLQFKDEDLLNKFNITVNEGKNELGTSE